MVDDPYRRPIGRPYGLRGDRRRVRCVVALEPPSALSVGLCSAHTATDRLVAGQQLRMHATGDSTIADLMEVFSEGRATVYRALGRATRAAALTIAPAGDSRSSSMHNRESRVPCAPRPRPRCPQGFGC